MSLDNREGARQPLIATTTSSDPVWQYFFFLYLQSVLFYVVNCFVVVKTTFIVYFSFRHPIAASCIAINMNNSRAFFFSSSQFSSLAIFRSDWLLPLARVSNSLLEPGLGPLPETRLHNLEGQPIPDLHGGPLPRRQIAHQGKATVSELLFQSRALGPVVNCSRVWLRVWNATCRCCSKKLLGAA